MISALKLSVDIEYIIKKMTKNVEPLLHINTTWTYEVSPGLNNGSRQNNVDIPTYTFIYAELLILCRNNKRLLFS